MARKPLCNTPLPEFTGDRLRLLAPLLSPRIVELAHKRIGGEKFFNGSTLLVSEGRAVAKLALLLVAELNPMEDLQTEEEALVRGIDADTLRKRKKNDLQQLRDWIAFTAKNP